MQTHREGRHMDIQRQHLAPHPIDTLTPPEPTRASWHMNGEPPPPCPCHDCGRLRHNPGRQAAALRRYLAKHYPASLPPGSRPIRATGHHANMQTCEGR